MNKTRAKLCVAVMGCEMKIERGIWKERNAYTTKTAYNEGKMMKPKKFDTFRFLNKLKTKT